MSAGGQIPPGALNLGRPKPLLDEKEIEKRTKLEMDQVVSGQLHVLMARVGDIAISLTENESLKDAPSAKKIAGRARIIYSELSELQLDLTEILLKRYRKLELLGKRKPVKV